MNLLEILYLLRLSRTSLGSAARESLVLGRQQQSILTEGFWAPTPAHTPNVPISCRDCGMVRLGGVCSSVVVAALIIYGGQFQL